MGSIATLCWKSNGVFCSFRFILQRQFLYSTSATSTTGSISSSEELNSLSSLTNWLITSLGFSQKQALSTSTKLTERGQSRRIKKVCNPNLLTKADLVVNFLQKKGLEKPQIRTLVHSVPKILTSRISRNLDPKMKFFQELGLSASDFAHLISSQHKLLELGLDSTIRPAVDTLRAIVGSNENVVRVIRVLRMEFCGLVTKHVVLNVSALQARGVPIESIQKCILQHPSPFVRKPEDFEGLVARAESKWGISPRSPSFLYAIHMLNCMNEETIESKCRVFESFGWDRANVVDLFRRNPACFGRSEGGIRDRLGFFMNELGYDPGYIIPRSSMLTYSLEKRVMPRYLIYQLLNERGLIRGDLTLYSVIKLNESVFLARFVQSFEDQIPDLLHIYTKSMSSLTHKQNKRGKNNIPFSRMKLKQV